jgi:hypothetical protein
MNHFSDLNLKSGKKWKAISGIHDSSGTSTKNKWQINEGFLMASLKHQTVR